MANFEIIWRAPEFEYREKDVGWYWLTIIIAVVILAIAVWQRNFLFGVFVILAELLILVWGNRKPGMVSFKLNNEGLTIRERKSYRYKDIEGFAIEEGAPEQARGEKDEWAMLILKFSGKFKPNLRVNFPKVKIAAVKKTMAEFVPEIEIEPSLMDSLERFLRF